MRSAHLLFLALTIMVCATAAGQQSDLQLALKVPHPVAVDGSPKTGYYVLTQDKVVYHYIQSSSGLQFSSRFALEGIGYVIDLTFASIDLQDSVIVSEWDNHSRLGFIRRYSLQGKIIQNWQISHIPSGIGFNPENGQIYFTTADSHEIYSVDIRGGIPHSISEVRDVVQLGPIALDTKRQIVYVAAGDGRLFFLDLNSRKITQMGLEFELPAALRFDDQHRLLYVADQVKKKIYAVDVSTESGRVIAESEQLTSPSGLAPGPENTLLITDEKSGSVYLGKVISSPVNMSKKSKSMKRR